jgi:hypothetical protein
MKMNASDTSWTDANQAHLVAEFARLKSRLRPESCATPLEAGHTAIEPPPAIDRLAGIFGLSGFEREVLLLCAGVEMDSELAALSGAAQGLPHRAPASFGLALGLLPEPHWSALTPSRPLRHFRLVEIEASSRGLTAAPLRIDERVLHYLAGVNVVDQRLQSLLLAGASAAWIADEHRAAASRIVHAVEGHSGPFPLFHLCGNDVQGQEDTASLAARQIGLGLFTLRAEELPPVGPDLDQLNILWQREALLLPAALLIQCGQSGLSPSARYLAERLPGLVFLGGREPARLDRPFLRIDVDKPVPAEQKRLWQKALGPLAENLNGSLDAVSEQFRLSARAIFSTGDLLSESAQPGSRDLWDACRSLSRPRLEDLAQRTIPCANWEDIVLPDLQKQTLRQLASQVRHRMRVHETWGFSAKGCRGLGVNALFTGESGTGKTMAAEVLARELDLDLYRIDLSSVVSKYIGETEKNLRQVFDAAEEGGVLLLFDEADALFGKRSNVKDSHDRYANIEVSYLLQRMEAYHGLAILTTNLKSSMDLAFQRRLRFIVNFPFPNAAQREAIWSRIFPPRTPTRGLDPRRLSQLNVAGGNIRNIALNAAFLAAAEGNETPVAMGHLFRAARLEAEKIERPLSEAEVKGWL